MQGSTLEVRATPNVTGNSETEVYKAEMLRSGEGHTFKIFRLETLTSTDVLQMLIDSYEENLKLKEEIENDLF